MFKHLLFLLEELGFSHRTKGSKKEIPELVTVLEVGGGAHGFQFGE